MLVLSTYILYSCFCTTLQFWFAKYLLLTLNYCDLLGKGDNIIEFLSFFKVGSLLINLFHFKDTNDKFLYRRFKTKTYKSFRNFAHYCLRGLKLVSLMATWPDRTCVCGNKYELLQTMVGTRDWPIKQKGLRGLAICYFIGQRINVNHQVMFLVQNT